VTEGTMPDPFPKRCACGASYTAEQWQQLRERGHQPDGDQVLEYRDCRCGSTIAVVAMRRAVRDPLESIARIADALEGGGPDEPEARAAWLRRCSQWLRRCVERARKTEEEVQRA